MSEPNQETNAMNLSVLPAKRKRGRPRKEDTPGPGSVPPVNPQNHVPNPTSGEDAVGKQVTGTIDGVFDAGFLISVKVGNSGPQLKGMVFDKKLCVPVTKENDIAPNIKMSMISDLSTPISVEPLQSRDPSFPAPRDGGQPSEAIDFMTDLALVSVSDQRKAHTAMNNDGQGSGSMNSDGQGSGSMLKGSEVNEPMTDLTLFPVSDKRDDNTVINANGEGSGSMLKGSEVTKPSADLNLLPVSDPTEEHTGDLLKLDSTEPSGDKIQNGAIDQSAGNNENAATETPAVITKMPLAASDAKSVMLQETADK